MIDAAAPTPDAPDRELARPWSPLRQGLLLAVASLTLNLVGNGWIGLWDRDEPRYAGSVREMRARGDWVSPSFNGEPRYHKPILIYWVMGLSTAIGGDNPFGARLGSALAGTATALLCWGLGRRMLGPSAAMVAALVLITAPIVVTESKLATTDATLALLLTAAQASLWRLNQSASTRWACVFWAALALAFLTKGPVGPALIAAAGLATWWFGGSTACWARLRWRSGLLLFAAVTLPWFLAIGLRSNGDFFRFALGEQVIQRLRIGMEEHGGFPGYYVVFTLIAFYPWSALAPAAIVGAWTRRKTSPALGFLLGWAIGPLILLELVKTKLIHYYLPAIPALALLVGWLIEAVSLDVMSLRRWPLGRLALALLGGIGVAATAGLAAGSVILPTALRAPCLALAAILIVGTLVSLGLFQRGAAIPATHALAVCWAAVAIVFAGWLLPAAEPFRLSRIVGERLAAHADHERARPVLITFEEPGVIYAMKRTAPTLRTRDEVERLLLTVPTLVAPVTPDQVDMLTWDGRFRVEVLESLEGFNLSKGKVQPLRVARLTLQPSRLALGLRAVEQAKIK